MNKRIGEIVTIQKRFNKIRSKNIEYYPSKDDLIKKTLEAVLNDVGLTQGSIERIDYNFIKEVLSVSNYPIKMHFKSGKSIEIILRDGLNQYNLIKNALN